MTYRIPLSSFVDQTARNAAAAAQSTANDASATASTAAQNAATALINAGTAQTAADNANAAAGTALAVASARNHIFIQDAQPTTSTLDDLWVDTANGRILGWDGSAWTVRQLGTAGIAANAITANLIAANAVGANQIAATAIDGKTITGATLRTASSGKRVQIDSANGVIAYNSSGQAVTQIRTSDGVLIATGAVITGELDTGAAGTARVRIYETTDGKGNPLGVIDLDDGVTGDTPGRLSAGSFGALGGGATTLSGGTFGGIAAPALVFSVDQAGVVAAVIEGGSIESDTGYQLLTLATGWANDTSGNYLPLQVRKDSSGVVHCWGLVRNVGSTTLSGVSKIASIPTAFRGPRTQESCAYSTSGVVRVDYKAGTTQVLELEVGSIPAGGYVAVNLSWPSNDLSVT